MFTLFAKTSIGWQETIEGLEHQRETLQNELQEMETLRKSHQLAAALGEVNAVRALDEINRKRLSHLDKIEDLSGAIIQAESKKSQTLAEEAQKERFNRASATEDAVQGYLEACREVDEAFKKVALTLERYDKSASAILSALGSDAGEGTRFDLTRANARRVTSTAKFHLNNLIDLKGIYIHNDASMIDLSKGLLEGVSEAIEKLKHS